MTMIITGDVDIDKRLRSLAGARGKSVVRSASRKGLRPAVRAIKAYPWPVKTGKMAEHIRTHTKVKALGRSRSHRGMVGAKVAVTQRQFKGKTEVLNQGDIFYFGFLELGFKHYKAGKIPGKFWLREIADSVRSEAQTIFRQALNEGIIRELKKAAV